MGRQTASEVVAQAEVNLMENLFDQGRVEEAWRRMDAFRQASKSDDYDRARDQRESRMNYLASQILLRRGQIDEAEVLIRENLESVRQQRAKKREGGFLRLLAEVLLGRDQSETALVHFNEAIQILKEVGNPRQLWQAHASLASAFESHGRFSEAKEEWGAASEIIQKTASGLSDRELREGFFSAKPVREILSKAEN